MAALEEFLISSDLGVKTAAALTEDVKEQILAGRDINQAELIRMLKNKVLDILGPETPMHPHLAETARKGPFVVLVAGVNGVGKTTTVVKLAYIWKQAGYRVLIAAADTFRAAAVEQLCHWVEKRDIPLVSGVEGSKPATVVYEAMQRAVREKYDIVIIDTAGRLHNKANLMQELEGVRNSIKKHQPQAPHETWLVIDGVTGQNAVSQARDLNAALPLTGLVVTKLDGTQKGGVVVAIKSELGVPVRYIGVGEGIEDLRSFKAQDFVEALFCEYGQERGQERDSLAPPVQWEM